MAQLFPQTFAVLATLLLTTSICAEDVEHLFGGPGKDGVRKMIRTQEGGFALGGWQDQEGIHGTGTGLIVSLDQNGSLMWQSTLSTSGRNQVSSILERPDGSFVAVLEEYPEAGNPGQVVLIELTNEGQEIDRHFVGGSGSDVADAIESTADGGYVLAGESAASPDGSLERYDFRLGHILRF